MGRDFSLSRRGRLDSRSLRCWGARESRRKNNLTLNIRRQPRGDPELAGPKGVKRITACKSNKGETSLEEAMEILSKEEGQNSLHRRQKKNSLGAQREKTAEEGHGSGLEGKKYAKTLLIGKKGRLPTGRAQIFELRTRGPERSKPPMHRSVLPTIRAIIRSV